MGCSGSKAVVERLEAENESLREEKAQLEAKSDAALLKEKAELEHRVQVLELKLESSHDLHADTTLQLEKAQDDLKREKHVTEALKHHLCGQLSEVRSLVWRKSASTNGQKHKPKEGSAVAVAGAAEDSTAAEAPVEASTTSSGATASQAEAATPAMAVVSAPVVVEAETVEADATSEAPNLATAAAATAAATLSPSAPADEAGEGGEEAPAVKEVAAGKKESQQIVEEMVDV